MEILKTKKRLTVFCIMLACVFALSFALAYAVSAPRQASATIETSHVDHTATAFSTIATIGTIGEDMDIYLDRDYEMQDVGLSIYNGNVCLCLNGYTLTVNKYVNIYVDSSASLTILDCQGGGKIVFASDDEEGLSTGIACWGTLTLESGTLESSRNKVIDVHYNATLNLNGGTIKHTLETSEINENYNAIFVDEYNEMTGNLNIAGGKIEGLVYSKTSINLDGYTDTSNPIDYYNTLIESSDNSVIATNVSDAGVINIKNSCCVVETDGENKAIAYWANVFTITLINCTSDGQLTQTKKMGEAFETVTIVSVDGSTLPEFVSFVYPANMFFTYTQSGSTATISGTPMDSSYGRNSFEFQVKATLPHYEHDGIDFTIGVNADYITGYGLDGGNYYLTEDVDIGSFSISNSHLCLNGYTITANSIDAYGSVFIHDCKGTGTIKSKSEASGMGLIYVNAEASLYVYGGNFSNELGPEIFLSDSNTMLYVGGGTFEYFPSWPSIAAPNVTSSIAIAGSPDIKKISTSTPINMGFYTGSPLPIFYNSITPDTTVAIDTTTDYVQILNEGYVGKQSGDNVVAAVAYNVKIVLNNASVVSGGDLSQSTISAIDEVIIKADDGYALPASVETSAGISYALAEDGKTATISGTPTANVEFTVNAVLSEYEITLNSNSGGVVANQVVESIGHQLKPAGLPVPTWDGYHRFLGWYTAAEGGEVATEQTLSSNLELFAHWAIEYKVTFDAKGGSVDPAYTYTVDGKITVLPSAEYDENHVFSAWYTAEKDGEKVTLDSVFTADTTIYARYIVVRSIDHIDKSTEGLVDTYTIYFTDGTTYVFTVTNGADGTDGVDGKTPYIGSNGNWWIGEADTGVSASGSGGGTPGADGKTPQLKINADTNMWEVSYDDGATWTSLGVKATGNDGTDGADGNGIAKIELTKTEGNVDTYTITFTDSTTFVFTVTNGTDGSDGADGADGKKLEMQINAETNMWEYRYEGDAEWISTGVKATGEKGADGKTPQLKIGVDNYWYVSYDVGATWSSLGVKATGNDGSDGVDGITPQLRINTDTKYWEVSYDNGASWNSLGVKATGEGSGSGVDGVTPKLRIDADTNMWEVSYDNGATWTSLGVKATGDKGADGADGNDGIGIASVTKIKTEGNVDTYRITFTDDSYFDFTVTNGTNGSNGSDGADGADGVDGVTPQIRINSSTKYWEVSYDNGVTWTSLGVKATGDGTGSGVDGVTPQLRINSTTNYWEVSYDDGVTWTSLGVKATGDKGADGTNGTNGTNGTDGRDGTNGTDGITPKIRINSSTKEWEVSYDDGATWTSMGVKAIPEQDENGNWVYETSDMGASGGSMDSKQYTTVVVVSCVASLLTIAVAVCVMLIVAKDKRRTQKILKSIMQEKEEK